MRTRAGKDEIHAPVAVPNLEAAARDLRIARLAYRGADDVGQQRFGQQARSGGLRPPPPADNCSRDDETTVVLLDLGKPAQFAEQSHRAVDSCPEIARR